MSADDNHVQPLPSRASMFPPRVSASWAPSVTLPANRAVGIWVFDLLLASVACMRYAACAADSNPFSQPVGSTRTARHMGWIEAAVSGAKLEECREYSRY